MYFGVDYHPEQWVFPYGGTPGNPESQWQTDAELAEAAFNVVRIGEFSRYLRTEDGKFDLPVAPRDGCDGQGGFQSCSPRRPPRRHSGSAKNPEILPIDERGQVKHEGTRRAVCLNSDAYWNHSKRIVEQMAKALGDHPQLIAWQIDNGIGSHFTEALV